MTTHPERLLENSRAQYNTENKRFIQNGGVVKRLFIIEEDKLFDKSSTYAVDLYKVFAMNKKCGVQIGMISSSVLDAAQKKDVIIYADKSCILEAIPLSVADSVGYSTLIFRKMEIESMQKNFDMLWNYSQNPQELAELYFESFIMDKHTHVVQIQENNYSYFCEKLQEGREKDG